MSPHLRCATCDVDLGAYSVEQLAAAVILHHGGGAHAGVNHRIEIVGALPPGPTQVMIACQHPTCLAQLLLAPVYRVPAYAVGAAVLLHHAAHEGHPFRLWLDGTEVVPQ